MKQYINILKPKIMNKTVVCYFDEATYNSELDEIRRAQQNYQAVLDEFNSFEVLKLYSIAELIKLVEDPESFISEKMEEGIPDQSWGPFRLSKKKAVQLLQRPDLTKLIDLCVKCRERQHYSVRHLTLKGKEVTFDAERIESLRESNSIIARTEDQKNLFDAHVKLTEAMKLFYKKYETVYGAEIDKNTSLRQLFSFNQDVKTTSFIIPATYEDRELPGGKVVKQTLTPEHSGEKIIKSPMEISTLSFFYKERRFPM